MHAIKMFHVSDRIQQQQIDSTEKEQVECIQCVSEQNNNGM